MITIKSLILSAIFLGSSLLSAQEEKGIKFEKGTWAEITAKAKKENKLVFLDAYAAWCGPCKWMAKNVFTNDTVAEFYNKNFINAKIDMEKGEGIELSKKYGVQAYPTLFYINGDGEMIHRVCGSSDVTAFVEIGKNAMNPSMQLSGYNKKFASGNYEPGFAYTYFTMLGEACLTPYKEAELYLKAQKEEDLKSRHNWNIMYHFLNDHTSPSFKYLATNKNEFEALYTKDSVNNKIAQVYSEALMNPKTSEKEYEELKGTIRTLMGTEAEIIIASSDMKMNKRKKDWINYAKAAERYVKSNPKITWEELNGISWDFYENVEDKMMLAKAEIWAKQSVNMKSEYANNDTYAAVLYKIGKKAEAKKAAEKAIELAKKEGADASETEQLLKKINAMK